MKELRYILISDGSSDRAFIPILNFLLIDLGKKLGIDYETQGKWADLTRLPNQPKSLADKVTAALDLNPFCDLLFIHRDAEKESREKRLNEIKQAVEQVKKANINTINCPVVSVIPIRMLEAWLLFDESAIRKAAGNPKGKCQIALPSLSKVEELPDPKLELIKLLKQASELQGRRLKKFNERVAIQRLADIIDDFSPLNDLNAFQALRTDLSQTLNNSGWR